MIVILKEPLVRSTQQQTVHHHSDGLTQLGI